MATAHPSGAVPTGKNSSYFSLLGAVTVLVVVGSWPVAVQAQNTGDPMAHWWEAANDLPNPWVGEVLPIPDNRTWGSTAGAEIDPTDGSVWIIDRCGSNTCIGSDLDPILHYDPSGEFLGSFGSGMFAFPHGIHVDPDGNVWITDPLPPDGRGAGGNVGQQVTKFSPDGEVLMALGTAATTGRGPNLFSSPSDVVVGNDGNIFIADGHGIGTTERIVKYDPTGNYLMEWGEAGFGPCGTHQFSSMHALEFDSEGRLFIGDRDNNRIQIYDQDGNYIDCWFQFGRPSGIHIDSNDLMYVSDSESSMEEPGDDGPPSAYPRGIRIGSASDGSVSYFIPDPNPQAISSAAEGVAATDDGIIFGAEVGPRQVIRYERR
jgi:DNA-binding beta-propeller fold protein YncE